VLKIEKISRGNAWFDLGTAINLLRAGEFVQIVQERQGQLVGSPEEASFHAGFLSVSQLDLHLKKLGNVEYVRMIHDALNSW
jgi:glucose-1-phosphate thymidylyltransferase